MATKFALTKTSIIGLSIFVFVAIIGSVFYISYLFANKAGQKASVQPASSSAQIRQTTQQIRKITFKNNATGETMELWADGTINYLDINGKLKKTARRGFAETIGKFHDLESLINAGKKIQGINGYQLIIETEQGTIIVNPGDQGDGGPVVDDIHDYIDNTINPTPRPTVNPTPKVTPGPTPSSTATPNPSGLPEPTTSPPFSCSDYYKSGKPIKISNIICGPETAP